jgi:hypothetical protein
MAFQYNFTVEHQRWSTAFRATYQATGTRQTEWIYDANQPAADTRLYVDKPRRFPLYPSVSYASNGASNQYHGLTLEAERRMARGLQWQASWTWSRDIGDVERGGAPENAFDLARERGPVSDMPQHRFVANLTYDLPFGKGRKYGGSVHRGVQAIAGGWTASLTYMASTGAYLTPTWTGRDTTGTRYTDSRTAPQITLRPDVLRDPRLSGSERTLQRWFDPTAFTAPAAGQFGTSGTGLVMGPGFSVMNAGAYKEFPIRERVRLRAELTASNALNHPNYRDPSLNISAQAGVINGIRGAARLDLAFQRNLRAGIRLDW